MQEIERRAAAEGRWLLTLDTAGDAAEALYRSLGYHLAGAIPLYARDALEERFDATRLMYKDLRGVQRAGQGNGRGAKARSPPVHPRQGRHHRESRESTRMSGREDGAPHRPATILYDCAMPSGGFPAASGRLRKRVATDA